MKNVVIVGGGFSAIATAHRFFQKAGKSAAPFKVTLVSRDTHFYWNLAAPRATIQGKIADDEIFQSIPEGFAQYGDKFEFVLASATGITTAANTLQITTADGVDKSISYDILVLATGSHTKADSPFKSRGNTGSTKQALHDLQASIVGAKSIVVAGAGPTGVELAGELADAYGDSKKVILVTSSATVLSGLTTGMIKNATKYLNNLKIEVRVNSAVESTNVFPNNTTEVVLASGEKIVTDVYIPTNGIVPNSSYLPKNLVNERGFIKVNDLLQVEGTQNVYAVGEVSDCEPMNFLALEAQTKHMAAAIALIVSGKPPVAYKKSTTKMIGVLVSKNYATGHFNGIPLPSFMLTRLRKVFFMDWLPGRVNGTGY